MENVINLVDVKNDIRAYVKASPFPESDWDIENWAWEMREWMYDHDCASVDDVPESVMVDFAMRWDVSDEA